MHLLQSGVAPEVIALWLRHESPNTTDLYVEADLEMRTTVRAWQSRPILARLRRALEVVRRRVLPNPAEPEPKGR
jgi:hypothetical protein